MLNTKLSILALILFMTYGCKTSDKSVMINYDFQVYNGNAIAQNDFKPNVIKTKFYITDSVTVYDWNNDFLYYDRKNQRMYTSSHLNNLGRQVYSIDTICGFCEYKIQKIEEVKYHLGYKCSVYSVYSLDWDTLTIWSTNEINVGGDKPSIGLIVSPVGGCYLQQIQGVPLMISKAFAHHDSTTGLQWITYNIFISTSIKNVKKVTVQKKFSATD